MQTKILLRNFLSFGYFLRVKLSYISTLQFLVNFVSEKWRFNIFQHILYQHHRQQLRHSVCVYKMKITKKTISVGNAFLAVFYVNEKIALCATVAFETLNRTIVSFFSTLKYFLKIKIKFSLETVKSRYYVLKNLYIVLRNCKIN